MQHTLSNPPATVPEVDSVPILNVVIAYEDFETGKHAKRTYDFLVEHLGSDFQFANQMWKFEVLSIPKLREMAKGDVAAADIVVVSCHGRELPEQVKAWLEEWPPEQAGPLALVALFDRPNEDPGKMKKVRNFLAHIARRAGMEFFAQPDEWPGSTKANLRLHLNDPEDLNQRTLSTLADVVEQERPPRRWASLE